MHDISDEQYENLRDILERVYSKPCTFEEAKVIGDGLIDIYLVLPEEKEVGINIKY